ncbi:Zinc finger CCCH domain-containing protein 20 [Hibiscus syriacus]|uniref:Zinc finger CCCH domain-containing protein 20 n=1 Tax=Hibiscus syriacus TaxID=106335 RepID=A0A6A2YHG9_HIBSY|nr:zinc finger CCCH domain-containing protein 20-like [Hibiscus syriacus]KAE8677149.1 Zinc finger CCCH domain-containing protein 20 [Hibiscus syriacus]
MVKHSLVSTASLCFISQSNVAGVNAYKSIKSKDAIKVKAREMMVGEACYPNPTVHIPPWPYIDDDLTAENNFGDISNPFLLREALASLQWYSSAEEPDVELDSVFSGLESPDSPVDAYSCDHFRMFEFKVRRCVRGRSHDWTECPYVHPGEKARRRDPRKFHYSGTACSDFKKGNCRKGDSCEFAHGVFESWLHPARYRTLPCKDGSGCRRRVCFFAHTPEQLRVVNFAGSHDSSPAESSPPVSPMAQLPSSAPSINSMVASLRNIQLGKVKSLPSSGFGSPRVTRPCLSSLPSTPTGNVARPGFGYLDFWDESRREEQVMERIESGKHLRSKMFEKMGKENSLERVNSGQCDGDPAVDWVSDLVN